MNVISNIKIILAMIAWIFFLIIASVMVVMLFIIEDDIATTDVIFLLGFSSAVLFLMIPAIMVIKDEIKGISKNSKNIKVENISTENIIQIKKVKEPTMIPISIHQPLSLHQPIKTDSFSKMKIQWTMEHDEICCEIYLKEIIENQKHYPDVKGECIALAKIKGLPQKKESITMKFQNIRILCDEYKIIHRSPFSGLSNYSEQNKRAFIKIILNNIIKPTSPNTKPDPKPLPVQPKKIPYKLEESVIHSTFGKGIVTNINETNIIVSFSNEYGKKTLDPFTRFLTKENVRPPYEFREKVMHDKLGVGIITRIDDKKITVLFHSPSCKVVFDVETDELTRNK